MDDSGDRSSDRQAGSGAGWSGREGRRKGSGRDAEGWDALFQYLSGNLQLKNVHTAQAAHIGSSPWFITSPTLCINWLPTGWDL